MRKYSRPLHLFVCLLCIMGCKSSIKEQEDNIYSRHLQRHVDLSIISTQMADNKSDMNLLLFNDADDFGNMDVKKIIDSLYRAKLIQPLILVVIHEKKEEEYGISLVEKNSSGNKPAKYNQFVIYELYPFIKKRSAIRKFKSVAVCGTSLGGITAFDLAWHNADKINKVGVFSGDFNYTAKKAINDSGNVVLEKINSSKKRPKLQYWFYAPEINDTGILHNTKMLISIINKKNIADPNDIQLISDNAGNNIISWRQHFASFLLWAFGK